MEQLLSVLIGVLVATSVYLMLGKNLLRFLFGLIVLSNAANLTIFVAGRLTPGAPPLVPEGFDAPPEVVANALPQALVLTAIVIAFGMTAVVVMIGVGAFLSSQDDHIDDQDQGAPPGDYSGQQDEGAQP